MLHSVAHLGNLTHRWIDLQARPSLTFDSRLLGLQVDEGIEHLPYWLVAGDRPDVWLSYKGMYKSGGLSLVWLAHVLRHSPPAAVHAHYGTAACQHRHFAQALGVPLVASFYGYDATMRRYTEARLWRGRFARLFRDAGAVVAEGPAMARRVEALGCPTDKIAVIRLPADAEGLATIERRIADSFVVVAAGRFAEKKGFDVAIGAFARALRGRDAKLVLVGGGPLERELRKLVVEERVSAQVEWLGALPFAEFMRVVAGASVAVFPSRQAADGDSDGGAPVTLIEGQWLGVPAVVSDHDDLPFVSAPDGTVVVPPLDVEAWAEALRAMHDDPEWIVRMGAAAAAFAREWHSPEANVAGRERVYVEAARR